jgi:hypothetical protein
MVDADCLAAAEIAATAQCACCELRLPTGRIEYSMYYVVQMWVVLEPQAVKDPIKCH